MSKNSIKNLPLSEKLRLVMKYKRKDVYGNSCMNIVGIFDKEKDVSVVIQTRVLVPGSLKMDYIRAGFKVMKRLHGLSYMSRTYCIRLSSFMFIMSNLIGNYTPEELLSLIDKDSDL